MRMLALLLATASISFAQRSPLSTLNVLTKSRFLAGALGPKTCGKCLMVHRWFADTSVMALGAQGLESTENFGGEIHFANTSSCADKFLSDQDYQYLYALEDFSIEACEKIDSAIAANADWNNDSIGTGKRRIFKISGMAQASKTKLTGPGIFIGTMTEPVNLEAFECVLPSGSCR